MPPRTFQPDLTSYSLSPPSSPFSYQWINSLMKKPSWSNHFLIAPPLDTTSLETHSLLHEPLGTFQTKTITSGLWQHHLKSTYFLAICPYYLFTLLDWLLFITSIHISFKIWEKRNLRIFLVHDFLFLGIVIDFIIYSHM